MKENRRYKRFDLFSALALLGTVLVLLFEAFFIFELYRVDPAKVAPYLPAAFKSSLAPVAPLEAPPEPVAQAAEIVEEAPAPVDVEPAPVDAEPAPIDAEPAPVEEAPVPLEVDELVPVG